MNWARPTIPVPTLPNKEQDAAAVLENFVMFSRRYTGRTAKHLFDPAMVDACEVGAQAIRRLQSLHAGYIEQGEQLKAAEAQRDALLAEQNKRKNKP